MTEKTDAPKTRTVVVWGDSIAAGGWPQAMEFIFNVVCNTGTSIRVVNSGQGGNPAAQARNSRLAVCRT